MVEPAQTDQVGPVIRPAEMKRHDVVELVPSANQPVVEALRAERLLGPYRGAHLAQAIAGQASLAHFCRTAM